VPETKLVLGTWGLAGPYGLPGRPMGYGQLDESTARDVLWSAWEAGIRWVDTAPSYGSGEGLRRVASW
jgi:aryl-alcohol dehydrogenase-like predicted oxidoreductase